MHDWLVWLVLEIAVPAASEVWCRPRFHLLKLLFSWANLDSSLNSVGRKWTCSLDIPLVEHSLLDCRVTSSEVIETVGIGLGAEHYTVLTAMVQRLSTWIRLTGEGQVMVLKVQTNAWKVDNRLDTNLLQLLWVTDTASLKNQWRRECTSRNNDLLASSESARLLLLGETSINNVTGMIFSLLTDGCNGLVGTVLTPTATPSSIITLSTLVLHCKCKFW